jgi:two-component system cell cycle response regulator
MRVLIAEDDLMSRLVLEAAVSEHGHELLVAENGAQAWDLFAHTPDVDVVITDRVMPGLDGLELCRLIRRWEEDRDGYTYLILLSVLQARSDLLTGIEAGADDYLTKPLDRHELQLRLLSARRVTALHQRLAEQTRQTEALNDELHGLARRDALTGLGNRLLLQEDLDVLAGRAARHGHGFCLVLCDADDFKVYNDRFGHQRGDELLRHIGATISSHCRAGDAAYRYGGEEFLVVLPEQTVETGMAFAERLRRALADSPPPRHGAEPIPPVSLSIGVAASSAADGRKDVDHVLREADRALYDAKRRGKNCVVGHLPTS